MGKPTVHPTGTTIYNPEKCFNGVTLFQAHEHGALLINMNGKPVRFWDKLAGFPNKLLKGGHVLGNSGTRDTKFGYQDGLDLIELDWDGNEVWKFEKHEYIEDEGNEPRWMSRQHHDYQREGNPVGYYVPDMEAKTSGGKTLILSHVNVVNPRISDKVLLDDVVYEVDENGEKTWEWRCNEHFNELGFSEEAKNVLFRGGNMHDCSGGVSDWMHINSMSTLGPNKWYDKGDERFHPDNIIMDARETNILFIVSRETGKIVWRVGPDYVSDKALRRMGVIVGQHHCHMIPRGLPGEGNILVYDNGGWAGYGAPNQFSQYGEKSVRRDSTRILEFNPVTLKIVWQYTPSEAGHLQPFHSHYFYSPFISSAQRLPNGNTLICEGSGGRLMEVTADHELVWEYISPYWGKSFPLNMVYRAYRYPYDYCPQLETQEEVAIERMDNDTWRLPGAAPKDIPAEANVTPAGMQGYGDVDGFCVKTEDEEPKVASEDDDEWGGTVQL